MENAAFRLAICFFLCVSHITETMAQACPGNDTTRYVHDTRTYGIWYNRARFDSAFSFPRRTSTITCNAGSAPQLYSLGPGSLWWWDGFNNLEITSGGAVPVVGAANGTSVNGAGQVILAYSPPAPNLYRSVLTKTAFFHTYGINADSVFLNGGTDTIRGPFFGVGNQSPLTSGPAFQAGYKNPSGVLNEFVGDSTETSMNLQLANGDLAGVSILDRMYSVFMLTPGYAFSELWSPRTQYPAYQVQVPNYMKISLSDTNAITSETVLFDTNFSVTINQGGGSLLNGILTDKISTTHVRRLSVNEDSILGNTGGSITAVISSDLGVPAGPTGYTIAGFDQGFTITFTTGTIVPGADSTDAVIRLSFVAPSEGGYIVTPVGYNSTAGIALGTIQPYIVNINNQTFELHGALSNWSGLGFQSTRRYVFSFKTVDY